MAFMVMSATPKSAHADKGCPDQDRLIQIGEFFHLGWNCVISGDVSMRDASGFYQRLYDDDDASTGLISRCTDSNGCDVRAEHGGYISARDTTTMVIDTFRFVYGLRYIDTKCWPTDCGVTRFFPSLSPPYYTTVSLRSPTFTPPYYPPPAPPSFQARQYFGVGQDVLGGTIVIGNQTFYGCYIAYTWTSGYVDYGSVGNAYRWGQTTCGNPPPVFNPCPSGGNVPYCTVNGMAERSAVGSWIRINQGEAAYATKILLDNGKACTVDNCYVESASSGGWVFNGWVNPLSWRVPAITVRHW